MRHATGAGRPYRAIAGWALVVALVVAACTDSANPEEGGERADIQRGRELVREYGCITCHTIPGVEGADGLVGPPLTHFSQRAYIAGQLTNTPENLARWIRDPQEVEPGTAMPDLGVTEADAADIAAFLSSID